MILRFPDDNPSFHLPRTIKCYGKYLLANFRWLFWVWRSKGSKFSKFLRDFFKTNHMSSLTAGHRRYQIPSIWPCFTLVFNLVWIYWCVFWERITMNEIYIQKSPSRPLFFPVIQDQKLEAIMNIKIAKKFLIRFFSVVVNERTQKKE